MQREGRFPISIRDIRFRPLRILGTFGLAFIALFANGAGGHLAELYLGAEQGRAMPWLLYYSGHTAQLIVTLVIIAIISRGRFGEYGLKWPPAETYIKPALVWGALFGVLMTVVDYFPGLLARTAPRNLPLTATNILGWLSFEGLWAGTGEEILFRGLLLTSLASGVSGRIRMGRYTIQLAGVVIAVVFALAHMSSFWTRPFMEAAGQQVYAFVLGILYAYWFEKSGSVLAPIIGHNTGNFLEYVFAFLMVWLWR
jgi:uncharacterized protein